MSLLPLLLLLMLLSMLFFYCCCCWFCIVSNCIFEKSMCRFLAIRLSILCTFDAAIGDDHSLSISRLEWRKELTLPLCLHNSYADILQKYQHCGSTGTGVMLVWSDPSFPCGSSDSAESSVCIAIAASSISRKREELLTRNSRETQTTTWAWRLPSLKLNTQGV